MRVFSSLGDLVLRAAVRLDLARHHCVNCCKAMLFAGDGCCSQVCRDEWLEFIEDMAELEMDLYREDHKYHVSYEGEYYDADAEVPF